MTPLFHQYALLKEKHKDAVLFFRLGDFYEMFESDAAEVSQQLNLTLTQRQGVPMCGVPHHAAGNYIGRLLKAGKKVAICEQVEPPPSGRGLAKREVVEVITPGTVVDDVYLDECSNNYLAAVSAAPDGLAFAYVDLSTGEFQVTHLRSEPPGEALRRELARVSPRELIVQESLLESKEFGFLSEQSMVLNRLPDWSFDITAGSERITAQMGTSNLKGFGLDEHDVRIPVAGVILDYLEDNARSLLPHIRSLTCYGEDDALSMDEATIRNLELVRNIRDGGPAFTLFETLDHTRSAGGARLLRRRLLRPSKDLETIVVLHDRVEALYHDQACLSALRDALGGFLDLERLSSRVAMERAHAKDLLAICDSLRRAMDIRKRVGDELLGGAETSLEELFAELKELFEFLEASVHENPSILFTEGRLIRKGWNADLDEMRVKRDHGKKFLDAYVAEERRNTGMGTLKLKHNRILGYFLEVTRAQASAVPEYFRRRQTLAGVERFSTKQLEDLETELNSVAESIVEREKGLFFQIRSRVRDKIAQLMKVAVLMAELDVLQSFAHAATAHGYVRPFLVSEPRIRLVGSRHPVVERHLPPGAFVPNSLELDSRSCSFALVTGPNMAGKSTVLRQSALITLMAQVGSFVPADEAEIGITDRIFCRVGSSDNLAGGESSFLVEMNETANILRNATAGSLVIMDEVGRGTGTEDGLAIARAVCEYLLEVVTPRTLFSTHYLELTRIKHQHLINLSMAVRSSGGQVIFPKNLIEGPAESSYGIHVAALAGLPEAVVRRAEDLFRLPKEEQDSESPSKIGIAAPRQIDLFEPNHMILEELRRLDIDSLTPLEALNLLARWYEDLKKSDTP